MASVFLVALLFGVYLNTICPTVYLGDSGELTAAAFSLGIPHNSGYPLYSLIGKIFCLLPVGNIGFRMNLMSASFATATLWIVYSLVKRMTGSRFGAFFSALVLAFSQVFWSQSTSAEVYTLHIFFVALLIRVLYWWDERGEFHILALFVFLTGLSFGNHLQTVMLAPGVFFLILHKDPKSILNIRSFLVLTLLFITPLILYLYLPIRTDAGAAITWGDPNNLERFWAHVSGRSHRASYVFSKTPTEYLLRAKETAQFIVSQFGVLLLLAGWGWLKLASLCWKAFFLLVTIFDLFYTIFLNIISLQITAFTLPTSVVIAILFGNGVAKIIKVLERRSGLHPGVQRAVKATCFAVPGIFLVLNFGLCNQSKNYTAYEHAVNIFRTTGRGDILFMNGDNYVFPILYARIVERMGEDRTLFDRNNIFYEWLNKGEGIVPYSQVWKDLRREKEHEIVRTKGSHDVFYAVFGPYAIDLPSPYRLVPYGVLQKVVHKEEGVFPLDTVWRYYTRESFYEDFQKDFMTREVAAYYHFNRGKALFHSGDIQRGVKTIMLASEIGFDDDLIHNDIAIFFIDRGFMKEGRKELEKALIYHEDLSGVYNNWGYYYHKMGEYGKAAEYLEKAVELKPDNVGYLNNLGFALVKVGRKKEALKVYKKSLRLKPHQPDVIEFMRMNGLITPRNEQE
ncbi:MAG: DUF2723 domain-containing protein [Deltaproteobacteria bacterium]|nr:DUF2723 domain-containing protein [Deltaproteobacteria bacterium]